MGLVAGIISRDGSDVSELLYKMAVKLKHRGNAMYCVGRKTDNGWELINCGKCVELKSVKSSFGVVGRQLIIDKEDEPFPLTDCKKNRFLLLDGRIFNSSKIKGELERNHSGSLNGSSVILHLIEELQEKVFNFMEIFHKLFTFMEGMFAGVLILKNHIFIFRDVIGIKPLYLYSGPDYVAFASERKALWSIGLTERIEPLLPGRVVRVARMGFTSHFQASLKRIGMQEGSIEYYKNQLSKLMEATLAEMQPKNPFYLLLSGGIDSSLLAALLKKMEIEFGALVLGNQKSKDVQHAQKAADFLDHPLEILNFDRTTLEVLFPLLIYQVEDRDEKKLNIAFPLFYGGKYLKKKNIQLVFTGQGADEIFGGYERHEVQMLKDPSKLEALLWEDIENVYEVNLQRDDAAAMGSGVELRVPYLSREFVELAMQIPPKLKINNSIRKYILRQVGKMVGLPDAITQQPKRAIQFSSGSYATLKKLARHYGFTKDFVLKHGFFSPTQTFIDSVAYLLGFPHIDPKIGPILKKIKNKLPESILKYENLVNTII